MPQVLCHIPTTHFNIADATMHRHGFTGGVMCRHGAVAYAESAPAGARAYVDIKNASRERHTTSQRAESAVKRTFRFMALLLLFRSANHIAYLPVFGVRLDAFPPTEAALISQMLVEIFHHDVFITALIPTLHNDIIEESTKG